MVSVNSSNYVDLFNLSFAFSLQDNVVLLILNYLLSQSPPKAGSPLTVTVDEGKRVSEEDQFNLLAIMVESLLQEKFKSSIYVYF